MVNVIILILVALMVLAALRFIYKQKKKGVKCIGCPSSGSCSGHCCERSPKG